MIRALWHQSASESGLLPVQRPRDQGLIAIESVYSMISAGSERLVALGRAAQPGTPLDAPYAEGSYGFPIKYGYSLVGLDRDGRLLHCLHPHQTEAFVRSQDCFELPATVNPRRGALLSNMETVLNAIWDARLARGEEVLLCGFGGLGALLANTLRVAMDIEPLIVETNTWRREKARTLRFEALAPEQLGGAYALVMHTSCSAPGLQFCIDHCAPDGAVVELSWYGMQAIQLELGAAFHRNRVRLISSQVSAIPPHMRETVDHEARKRMAGDLLTDSSYDELLADDIEFAALPEFFRKLRLGQESDGLIRLVRY